MLHRKTRLFVFALFCAALISGTATESNAQDSTKDSTQDNTAQTDSSKKHHIPAALIARWQKEAEEGNADAQFLLGNAYYTGNGVDQDYSMAASWWHKSAAQGNVNAQNALDGLVQK